MVEGEPTIAVCAHRHGTERKYILHPSCNPMWFENLDDGLPMVIGPDATGRLLEIGIVDEFDGPVVVRAAHV